MSEKNESTAGVDWRSWVAALRSGKYKQGHGYLCSRNGFCCWGVACDIVDPNGWRGPEDFSKGPLGYKNDSEQLEYLMSFAPVSVIDTLGVQKLDQIKYAAMNDDGKTFLEIADAIEKEMTSGTI